MRIVEYNTIYQNDFTEMFLKYFNEDLQYEISEEVFKERLLPLMEKEKLFDIIEILLAIEDGETVGFIIYQIDCEDSDWNKREGWGFVRELYVDKNYRHKSIGSALVGEMEKDLFDVDIYLTSQVDEFWLKNQYEKTDMVDEINEQSIFEKRTTI